tara:strand:- start:12 stop:722 length:711 start_codon:yes stop_codon:yes gene_type:complete
MSKNLIKRTLTSVILLSFLLIVNFSNHLIFITVILILGGIICFEFNNIFTKLVRTNFLKLNKHTAISKKFNFIFLLLNLLVFFYIFFIFCVISTALHGKSGNPTFFLYLISICFFSDIGGYVVGKILGGKKLTKISPNKTISGTVGSFIFCILPLIIFNNLNNVNNFEHEFNLKNIFFCILLSLVSQLGDLFISYLKRKTKIKDTGKILPGHGGILDRLDGIIFAIPFSYLLLKFI